MRIRDRMQDLTCSKCFRMMDVYTKESTLVVDVDESQLLCDECMVRETGHPNTEFVTVMKEERKYY